MEAQGKKTRKKRKHEQMLCSNLAPCVYKSYFGDRCIAHKHVIWRTCRFKTKSEDTHEQSQPAEGI